jgi:hypothetical protein
MVPLVRPLIACSQPAVDDVDRLAKLREREGPLTLSQRPT